MMFPVLVLFSKDRSGDLASLRPLVQLFYDETYCSFACLITLVASAVVFEVGLMCRQFSFFKHLIILEELCLICIVKSQNSGLGKYWIERSSRSMLTVGKETCLGN